MAIGVSPSLASAAPAVTASVPSRKGTFTLGSGVATVRFTVDPCGALPGLGDCASTVPAGCDECCLVTLPTTNLSCWRSSVAWSCVSPTRSGTTTGGGPGRDHEDHRRAGGHTAPRRGGARDHLMLVHGRRRRERHLHLEVLQVQLVLRARTRRADDGRHLHRGRPARHAHRDDRARLAGHAGGRLLADDGSHGRVRGDDGDRRGCSRPPPDPRARSSWSRAAPTGRAASRPRGAASG